jgi:hypothetical protein
MLEKLKVIFFLKNYSWACRRKSDDVEGKIGTNGIITKLERLACLQH